VLLFIHNRSNDTYQFWEQILFYWAINSWMTSQTFVFVHIYNNLYNGAPVFLALKCDFHESFTQAHPTPVQTALLVAVVHLLAP